MVSGVMFPIRAKQDLPVCRIVVHAVAVRGYLGPMSVWVSQGADFDVDGYHHRRPGIPDNWTQIYERHHAPSRRRYETLDFSDNPVILLPGETRMLYIHSRAPHDRAIVYDHTRPGRPGAIPPFVRYEDSLLEIFTGKAHLSTIPFGHENIWGWGTAWREHREFVGKLQYGAVYQLWQPELHFRYGSSFQIAAETLFLCQRREESPMSRLPDECIFYILNLCRWDWFDDAAVGGGWSSSSVKRNRRSKHTRYKRLVDRSEDAPSSSTAPTGVGPRRPWRFGYSTLRDKLQLLR